MRATSPNGVIGEEPNSTYRGLRLLYNQSPEGSFDPLESGRYVYEFFKQVFIRGLIWAFGGFVAFIFFGILSFIFPTILILWLVLGAITWLALYIVFFFRPIPAGLSDWKLSVEGKAEVAGSAFEHIAWVLQNRCIPIKSLRVQRITQPFVPTRDYLVLKDGIFVGYISCFAYGTDLYLAWTLWLSISPARFFLERWLRLYRGIRFRESDLFSTLRYENARAMREAMHSAAREGVDVAVGSLAAQGQGTIGSDIPIDVSNLTV